jgi:hypothetical protein
MGNRLNNFRSARPVKESVAAPTPSRADALGIRPPKLTAEQSAGQRAENALAGKALDEKIRNYEAFQAEREAFEKARNDAIMERVIARQRAAI